MVSDQHDPVPLDPGEEGVINPERHFEENERHQDAARYDQKVERQSRQQRAPGGLDFVDALGLNR